MAELHIMTGVRDESLTIGQLARSAGVPSSTIRFYEREGLLAPDARTSSNYRAYSSRSVERLKFIRAAQTSGFSLADIRGMLELTHSDEPPCDEIAALIEHRLAEVREKLRELNRVNRVLSVALKTCCKGGSDWCSEIERLKGRPRASGSPARESGTKSARLPLTLH